MNWDDLRVARAVYRGGSFAAAARALGVNETTVARRLSRLEHDLGGALFEAADGARRPTARYEAVVAIAELMAGQAERIARIGDAAVGLAERRRIAATDSIAAEVLAPKAPSFLADHPGIALDFMASTENVDFSRWEADLALRLRKPDKGDFVISKIADLDFYLFEPASAADNGGGLVCAYPEDLDPTPESRHMMRIGLQGRARCRTKNLLVLKKLLQSRRCAGVLPSFLGADLLADPAFKASKLPESRGVWLLVQSHLKTDAATRAVIDWIRDCFAGL